MLEKPCTVAKMEVRWCHEQVAGAGWEWIMHQIRSSGLRVTRCSSLVRSVILKCVRYKQLRGKCQMQAVEGIVSATKNDKLNQGQND